MLLCRRRHAGQFRSEALRRSQKIGCGAVWRGRQKIIFSKIPENLLFFSQNFLMTMASAARRQIIAGSSGALINKCRRRRRPQTGGAAHGRQAHGSNSYWCCDSLKIKYKYLLILFFRIQTHLEPLPTLVAKTRQMHDFNTTD